MSANKGNIESMISCTKMLVKGNGIENNEEEAMNDYLKYSKEGNDEAFLMLGKIYYNNDDEESMAKAEHFFQISSNFEKYRNNAFI